MACGAGASRARVGGRLEVTAGLVVTEGANPSSCLKGSQFRSL